MKHRISAALVLCATTALLASTTALAGFRQGQSVVIVDASRFANGMLGQVYNTTDVVQYIGCSTNKTTGQCFATNSAGLQRSCFTADAALLTVMRSLSSDSYLTFSWDTAGNCTAVNVSIESTTPPKK